MLQNAEKLEQELRELRRDFHKYAEVKWTEFRTTCKVAQRLQALGIPVLLGKETTVPGMQFSFPDEQTLAQEMARAKEQGANQELLERTEGYTGAVGILDTGRPGPVVAMRFDMDALPIDEENADTHFPCANGFSSINHNCTHACGHDGHTAIGLVLAEVLAEMQDELCGKIKFIFQPSEEGGGGARGMVERGLLDDVDYFFAPHMGLSTLDGKPLGSHAIMGGARDFLDSRRYNVSYIGKAAHPCGDPNNGKNALLAACNAALNVHAIAPHCEGMMRVNVGVLHAGVGRNTIAPEAHMELEVRGENDAIATYAEQKMLSVVRGAADMYQLECEIQVIGKTLSGQSDDAAIEMVMEAAHEIPWYTEFYPVGSVGGTDDASDMMRRVQEHGGIATYIGLGADFAASFHNRAFNFDEDALLPGVELFVKLIQQAGKRFEGGTRE